tara:strand:+ start:32299 stop:33024 length:726 start_codon:yes stop_codon:yes gene_type:complete
MNLIIDIGNTRAKVAVFQQNKLVLTDVVSYTDLSKKIKILQKEFDIPNCIIASVGKINANNLKILSSFKNLVPLNHSTKAPFVNTYKTPKTLGVDRIALVAAAVSSYPNKNVLIIDAGTCITYDFVDRSKQYFGGAISPGIGIRYRALNTFTANLPELKIADFSLIGKNTNESIHSGVLNGTIQEINGIIEQYQNKYSNLTVVLTGGDINFLAKKLKSSIFANPIFLLEGLNSILIHNLDE